MAGRPELSLQSRVVAVPDQVSADLEDEVVVLSLRSAEYFGFNPVAASVWKLIQEPRSLAEVRDALLEEFSGVTPEQCAEQLLALAGEMAELELIRVI